MVTFNFNFDPIRIMGMGRGSLLLLAVSLLLGMEAGPGHARVEDVEVLDAPVVRLELNGEMGRRVKATVDQWLLPAWDANPGMIEMFRLRDRQPAYERPVPWAGEFVGKYLISAVQLRRMSNDSRLDERIREAVAELIATQAEDGYLGPFREDQRLLGHWDLWGHYHVMLGLYLWYQASGSQEALDAALRAADLSCRIYLDGDRRVYDAGDYEMNMAIIHVLGMLHRETGNARYLQLMRAIEEDWQRPGAGDYYRQALEGIPFYQTPRPRWESLHNLQGLRELYQITGDASYRQALLHYWHSIHATDVHNAGSFSVGEGAVGNPFVPGAIETCCTVAWIALSIDALALSGDSRIADAIENSTWNGVLGFQHPSGRWVTYDTPMDGKREASAHSIVFQARAGTPELNCCSVNGPRGLGMISEWALLTRGEHLYLNYYGAGRLHAKAAAGTDWRITQVTDYPATNTIRIQVDPATATQATLHLRIPEWSRQSQVRVNGEPVAEVKAGAYLPIERTWQAGDRIELVLDFTPRALRGDEHVRHQGSLYLGPLLLAFDQAHNAYDFDQFPELDFARLTHRPIEAGTRIRPLVLRQFTAEDGRTVNLCDYATAGAHGTQYHSWLPMKQLGPNAFGLKQPGDGLETPAGVIRFSWESAGPEARYDLKIAEDEAMTKEVVRREGLSETHSSIEHAWDSEVVYHWQVEARNGQGALTSKNGPWAFRVNPAIVVARDEVLLRSGLEGSGRPAIGVLLEERAVVPARDRAGREAAALAFNGASSRLRYQAEGGFPTAEVTFAAWIQPTGMFPEDRRFHQVFSAWWGKMDDPLRVTIIGTGLRASVEAGRSYATQPVALENGRWYHLAVVKQGARLTLYLDGEARETIDVPETVETRAEDFGIGCNPHFQNGEHFSGVIDDVELHARALDAPAVRQLYASQPAGTDAK